MVPEEVTAEIVLIPLVHFLVSVIDNSLFFEEQDTTPILLSLLLQDFTHTQVIGSVKVSVVLIE
ncbi:MAG: hypothetical protein WCH65_04900 [bacterium]